MDSQADNCIVASNVFVVYDHECYVDVYSFQKEKQHAKACVTEAAIAYKDPVTHSTVIEMINKAIKIDSMTKMLVYPVQWCVHGTVVSECSKFLLHSSSEEDHVHLVHGTEGCSPPLTSLLSLDSVTSYFNARCSSLEKYNDKIIPKST